MKITILFWTFLLVTTTSFNSDRQQYNLLATDNLVKLTNDIWVETPLEKSYKTKNIKKVFAQLKKAKGDFRYAQPQLRFVKKIPNNGKIAVAYPSAGVIFFEEKMYDVCMSVGKDSLSALAAVLSHELTHCYEKHTWEDHFKKDFQATQMDSLLHDNYLNDEIQADYLGGFLAYAAGYQPFGIMETLYKKEYAAFGLTDMALAGNYPPMKERIEIAEQSEKKLKLLIDYFEMGNWLIATQNYEEALLYFNAVEREFQSREIYNNLGVLSFLSAMDKFDETTMPYAFPIELDVQSRLGVGKKATSDKATQIEQLQRAIEYFEKARKMDSFYPIAYLNLGCAQALLGFLGEDYADLDFDEAEISARRALRLAKGDDEKKWQKTIADAHILLGLIEALRNAATIQPLQKEIDRLRIDNQLAGIDDKISALKTATKNAVEWMDKALQIDQKSPLAILNKNALEGTNTTQKVSIENAPLTETINGKKIVDLVIVKEDILDAFFLQEQVIFAVKNLPQSKVFIHSLNNRGINFYVAQTDYTGSSEKGIKTGADFDTVTTAYPYPYTLVNLANGFYAVYDSPSLIFQLDDDNKVKQWAIYRRQK